MMTEAETVPIGKREERRLERRHAIIAVATRSFLENGYDGTTMSRISTLLGGSKGTLWNHFSSKEDLFAAFLDESTSAFKRELLTVLEPSRDLRSTLETFARRFIEKISLPESLKLYRLVIGESGRSPEVGRMFYERGPGAVEAMLVRFLEERMKDGNLWAGDPLSGARLILGQCVACGHRQMLFGEPSFDPTIVPAEASRIVDMFLRLYAPDEDDRRKGAA